MAATELDAAVADFTGLPASFVISAGSDRTFWLLEMRGSGSNATPNTGMEYGGQACTSEKIADTPGHNVSVQLWTLDEAGIAAKSGDTITPSGGGSDNLGSFVGSVQDTNQTSITVEVTTSSGTSGTLSLERAANSFTIAANCHNVGNLGSMTNPAETLEGTIGSSGTATYGDQTDSAGTSDVTWANAFDRDNAILAANFLEVSSVQITTVTDPAITGTALTIVGTGFTPDTGSNGTKQEQGAIVVALTETARSATSITATSATIESTQLKYGINTIRVTADGGNNIKTFTATPVADNAFVDLTSIAVSGLRIKSIPDLSISDQLRHQGFLHQGGVPTAFDVIVNDDATFSFSGDTTDGSYTFEVIAFNDATKTWGTAALESVTVGAVAGDTGFRGMSLQNDRIVIIEDDGAISVDSHINAIAFHQSKMMVDSGTIGTIVNIPGGFIVNERGALYVAITGTIAYYYQGVGFTADGRLVVAT